MLMIRIYQWTISPLIGDVCRFTPSCSKYGYEAFKRHGFLKGFWLTSKRVLKCNPWCNHCGIDEVP